MSWGAKTDAAGKLSKVDVAKVSEAVPSQNFMAPAKLWDAGHARGSLITAADDTKVFDGSMVEKFKLKKDTKLEQQSKSLVNDIMYLFVKIDASAAEHSGDTGYIGSERHSIRILEGPAADRDGAAEAEQPEQPRPALRAARVARLAIGHRHQIHLRLRSQLFTPWVSSR